MANEALKATMYEAFSRQPAKVEGLYRGLPYNPDGYEVRTDQALTIRQHAGVAIAGHLPIDVVLEAGEGVKKTMVGEHTRARRISGLSDDDHLALRALTAEYYAATWAHAADAKRKYAKVHGMDLKDVREAMLGDVDRAALALQREDAKNGLAHDMVAGEIHQKQRKYLDVIERTRKVGVSPKGLEFGQHNTTIVVDVFPVPYAFYEHLSTPEIAEASGNIGELLATGASIITSDNVLIIQIRGENNKLYGDMLGTSAGGLADSRRNSEVKGSVKPVTTASIIENIVDESNWEVGQDDQSKIKNIKIINMVREEEIEHTEAIVHYQVDMTFDEFAENAWIKKGRPSPRPGHEFAEDFIGIPADARTILAFLAVPRPLPATHYATIVGTGFMDEYKRTGSIEAAEAWQQMAERVIAQSRREVDAIVRRHWESDSQKAAVYKGDKTKYDPRYPAGMQGLGGAIESLKENGIDVLQWKPSQE